MPRPQLPEFGRYLRTETAGGVLLLVAAAVALGLANSPLSDWYHQLAESVPLDLPSWHIELTVAEWTKDGLLTVFFFVAGLELKRELVVGELADRKRALLPVVAACGGVVVPALIAAAVGAGVPQMDRGWAIPVATDIAFALAVLALSGSRVPTGARAFLLSLAVVDDLLAITLVAILFTAAVSALWLGVAAGCVVAYAVAQRFRIRSTLIYLPLALLGWYATYRSGIHPTLIGVAFALATRVRPDPGEAAAPAIRLEHRLQPWSAGFCAPLFALFAAGVPIDAAMLHALFTDRIALAVAAGLLIGKTVGIFGVSWLAIRIGLGQRPAGLAYRDLFALSVLGAVGFTVSLLIVELSLTGEAADVATAAVLATSLIASLLGSALLLRQ
ncbi:Na+/H+ antiporter NhaA [Skermania piniformis]|uniref:Na(+)/H(+) antiporter NhaA n=1 Tax=Skermania pinensis TaxID=39122 RepID=A0ABX8S8J8_9ACTN|nr:Na+/H+ antiporter NhaA [Skermania piniformis]QXQ14198.1 Na+/H+ antiporter NhaA [Skermania piniformis]